jgi:hypothetical protein
MLAVEENQSSIIGTLIGDKAMPSTYKVSFTPTRLVALCLELKSIDWTSLRQYYIPTDFSQSLTVSPLTSKSSELAFHLLDLLLLNNEKVKSELSTNSFRSNNPEKTQTPIMKDFRNYMVDYR